MNDLQTKWLAALRSGKYTQDKGAAQFRGTRGHCCLGVAADECFPETIYSDDRGELAVAHEKELGLQGTDQVRLYSANDSDVHTFDQIADALEAYWTSDSDLLTCLIEAIR